MGVPIVGRGDELAQLRAALVAASGGSGRLLLVSGEPGIGKTRIATAAADMAGEYGVPAAFGCAIDDPGMPPLWPWREVGKTVPAVSSALAAGSPPRRSMRCSAMATWRAPRSRSSGTCRAPSRWGRAGPH